MIEVKGTSIISQLEFVRRSFKEGGYLRWHKSLSPEARTLVDGVVLSSSWYSGDAAVFELRDKICSFFFGGDPRGMRELGRFSADRGLTGIYRIFVKLGSPEWICSRATQVFGQYFRPAELYPVVKEKGRVVVRLTRFPAKSEIFEETICGFSERALELSGGKEIKVERTSSLFRGDPHTDIECTWTL